jgi:hypothetical protein
MSKFIHFQNGVDPGDQYDKLKWNFNESKDLKKIIGNDNYPYLLKNIQNLKKLQEIRAIVNNMAKYTHTNLNKYPEKARDGLKLFVYIHGELPKESQDFNDYSEKRRNYFEYHFVGSNGNCSNVIYSEMPHKTPFAGLNKPKERHINTQAPKIGKDENLRSQWRHIFFKLPNNTKPVIRDRNLINLVIHEITHTAANHQRWRPDDHGEDFQMYEGILKDIFNKSN